MPRPPYTTETPIVLSIQGLTISLLEIDGDPEIADLNISPVYENRSIPLAPILEWLWANRPDLMKAGQEAAWQAAMTAPAGGR